MKTVLAATLLAILATPAAAGEADIEKVTFVKTADGTYRFRATVRHADEGWDHYADAFEIVLPDGTVAATRVLAHPHVDEQPFTRNQGGVVIPEGVTHVIVRAKDSVHGLGGKAITVSLD